MEKLPKHLLKVHRNMYVSKNDDRFLEKYLKFFPDDPVKLYEYASKLEKEGQILRAVSVYERAAQCGNPAAKRRLQEMDLIRKRMESEKINLLEREHRAKRLLSVAILLFLFALFLFAETNYDILNKVFHLREVEHHYYEKEVIHHPPKERVIVLPEGGSKTDEESLNKTSVEDLPALVVQNALFRYKEEHVRFPRDLSELTEKYPDNWLSFIPGQSRTGTSDPSSGSVAATERKRSGHGTSDPLSGSIAVPDRTTSSLLELHFYPLTRQLAVARDKEVLALYPVAAGRTALPFTESKVINRIVNPNGGEGVLGSRGLELQDRYAIHGTNDPLTIGKNVTDGCLRLFNKDIETLYPYISKGTPFKVKEGIPPAPTFPSGLPPLGPLTEPDKEENPGHRYLWRG